MRNLSRLILAASFILVLFFSQSLGQSQATIDPLTGIWASETKFIPALKGELTVAQRGSTWRASLSGAETGFQVTGASVVFRFPGNLGQFRGRLIDEGRAIEGFWLQPSAVTEAQPNPTATSQDFATPITLHRVGRGIWRGLVQPLEESFTLYLKIFRNAEGSLTGAFRNPEINSNGGSSHFSVTREGDSVSFSVRPDPAGPEIRHNAVLAHSPDRLRIFWPDLGRTIELKRLAPSEVASFFPRPTSEPSYVYSQPPVTGDGWKTARARDVGIDEAALTRLIQRLIEGDPSARRPSLIHSLLVARHGKLVLEEYFFGFNRDKPHDMRSAGKTFASVMLGAAMMQGTRLSPETPLYNLLEGFGPFANPDPRKSQITLAHLMTHNSGLACDDNDNESPGNEGTMQTQRKQPNWWKYTLDLPVAHDPGSRYAYCSANINLVGAALTTATGAWLPRLFERTVARPLQFGSYYWNLMPNGEGYLGGGVFLRPRDLLKLGQAYLDGGVWNGRRIVAASWITDSTAPHAHVLPATTGLSPEQFPMFYGEADDGYAWHLGQLRVGERTFRNYAATGNGGQLLIVVPELDLTVVFTGGNYMQGGIWGRWPQEIVGGMIIPAISR
ncbi:MAG TPA: serine hydrolase [Pyrinomonadaceae bacterium]